MRRWLAWALAILFTSAAGQECHRDFTINPSDNTTQLFESCTTVVGNIEIGHGLDGEVYLRDVYNVTGTIDFRADGDHDGDSRPVVHLFDAPDLVHLGGLNIHEGCSVYELYLEDLETVGDISVYVDEYALNLHLESLVEADSINISRALSTLHVDSLTTVHGALVIDFHAANSSSNEPSSSNYGRIDFPSLESAGSVNLAGATENITLPRLTSVGPPRAPGSNSGLTLNMEKMEKPFELDLPRLQSVEDRLHLYGNVKEIHAPRLTNFTAINVISSTTFDCDTFLTSIERPGENDRIRSSFTCSSTPSQGKGLSTGAKIAIGVVVPVVVIAVVVGVSLFCVQKKSRRQSRARMELRVAETERAREGGETPPPPYSAQP